MVRAPWRGLPAPWQRVIAGVALVAAVLAAGTIGYSVLGLGGVEALYQTVITVFTVGYREVGDPGETGGMPYQLFTIAVVVLGAGTALFTLGVFVDALVEGSLGLTRERRRMDKRLAALSDHVVVCGGGRVGSTIASYVSGAGRQVVVIDREPAQVARQEHCVVGDATDDAVLLSAGLERARALVAALATDADNLYVTLSARAIRPDILIVARARYPDADAKLVRAGADRVVNPQHIGGARMAELALQPHVADFLDIVVHDGTLEFRLAEVAVSPSSDLAGRPLADANLRAKTGALVLAVRDAGGVFVPNPDPALPIHGGSVLIAIGSADQLAALRNAASGSAR